MSIVLAWQAMEPDIPKMIALANPCDATTAPRAAEFSFPVPGESLIPLSVLDVAMQVEQIGVGECEVMVLFAGMVRWVPVNTEEERRSLLRNMSERDAQITAVRRRA